LKLKYFVIVEIEFVFLNDFSLEKKVTMFKFN